MTFKIEHFPFLVAICLLLSLAACTSNKTVVNPSTNENNALTQTFKNSGGSSGMEQIDDCSYLAVYDYKKNAKDVRLGLIRVNNESLTVAPIPIHGWDKDGISNDLESICAIPGKDNEYLIAESGNWQGELGRIFHIKVDTMKLFATVLGSIKLPMLYRNDFDVTGDQYEAITCLPYDKNNRIVILGERGGSKNYPNGIVRWGVLNIQEHSFKMGKEGTTGIPIDVPGHWTDKATKRSITDFHIDQEGIIWASASEDLGDTGPFYSIIYKLGKTDSLNKEKPFTIFKDITIAKEVNGFKIEALSGPCKNILGTHSFGTEDEIYGGVWRPIHIE
ncbi:hypothetical protein HPE56_17000 [Maribacter sp. ANRC-HE7]|uniref:Uncharacterized protein n=1 Tax=Maribacter aquimaris TaxID=2737171 RepID=A0ABR7V4C4_9FLAO|nr:hypothetical protein [Maribacter aquimaris]MBD0779501.1 hypothetical protein [Maribacter aquimaris]